MRSSSSEQHLRRSAFSPSKAVIHEVAVVAVAVAEVVEVAVAVAVGEAASATVAIARENLGTRPRLRRQVKSRRARSANAPLSLTAARTWVYGAKASLSSSRRKRLRQRTHSRFCRFAALSDARHYVVDDARSQQESKARKSEADRFCCTCIPVNIRICILCLIYVHFAP